MSPFLISWLQIIHLKRFSVLSAVSDLVAVIPFQVCEHLVKTRAEVFLTAWRYLVGTVLEQRASRRSRSSAEASTGADRLFQGFGEAELQIDWNESGKLTYPSSHSPTGFGAAELQFD